MTTPLQFWFDFASTYSYVAALRVERECAQAGVPLEWKPFLLGPIFSEQLGIRDSPFNVQPIRGRYMWRDLERLCAKLELPWRRPSSFPRNSVLAARIACVGVGTAWGPEFVRSTSRANFAEDRDIGDGAVLTEVLRPLVEDPAAVLTQATSDEIKARLRAHTTEASQRGLFGAPSFTVGEELFFGQDRLTDAIEWAGRS